MSYVINTLSIHDGYSSPQQQNYFEKSKIFVLAPFKTVKGNMCMKQNYYHLP